MVYLLGRVVCGISDERWVKDQITSKNEVWGTVLCTSDLGMNEHSARAPTLCGVSDSDDRIMESSQLGTNCLVLNTLSTN
jgi:hypothetical protein